MLSYGDYAGYVSEQAVTGEVSKIICKLEKVLMDTVREAVLILYH